jgi:hypothetical protein
MRGKRIAGTGAVVLLSLVAGVATAEAAPPGSSGYFTLLANAPGYLDALAVAAPLPDGRVLIAGGDSDGDTVVRYAQLYDPTTESFSTLTANPGTELTVPRLGAVAAPLPDGDVLIAGGSDGSNYLQSAELFNPVTDTFQGLTASGDTQLQVPRQDAVAAPLPDGDVLITGGGDNSGCQASAELFHPSSETFTKLPASGSTELQTCVEQATAAPLPDGDVLIAGAGADAQLFSPATNTFSQLSSGASVSYNATATALPDGQVLLAGGGDDAEEPVQTAELFNAATKTFTPLPASGDTELQLARYGAASAPLPNGDVLIAGGFGSVNPGYISDTAELYVTPAESAVTGGTFGAQTVGQPSADQSLLVTNVGAQLLRIGGAAIPSGADASDFAIDHDACAGESLAFGHSCAISVRFTPGTAGSRSAQLQLEDNETAPASVSLTGTGVPANAGPTGPTGKTGPRGPAGRTGELRLVTCTVTRRKGKKHETCKTRTIASGTATFRTATAHATLERKGLVYATGTVARGRLILRDTRRVPSGRYTLILTYRSRGSKITKRFEIRIG